MEEIYIVGAARTPIGKFGGTLAKMPAADEKASGDVAAANPGRYRPEVWTVIRGSCDAGGFRGQRPPLFREPARAIEPIPVDRRRTHCTCCRCSRPNSSPCSRDRS